MKVKTIKYNKLLIIKNLDQLPHGTGSRYLEALRDDIHGCLIAYCWRKSIPDLIPLDHVLIAF